MRTQSRLIRTVIAIVALAMLAALTAALPTTPSAGAQEAPPARESSGDPNDLVGSDGSVVDVSVTEAQLTADFVPGSEGTGVPTGESAPEAAAPIPEGTSSPSPGGRPPTESVIGPDDRSQVNPTTEYPDTAIGQITYQQYGGSYICTGFLIDPNTVVTSGHCVNYGGQGTDPAAWSYNVVFYPGRNGGTSPHTCNSVTALYTTKGWLDSYEADADFGFIQLGGSCSDIGNMVGVGWFGYFADTDANLLDAPMNVRGYPGDKPSGTMWTMEDQVRVVEPERLYYQADTFGGQSGSPVFNDTQFEGDCGFCAMAVHSYGTYGGPPTSDNNSGPRITRPRFIQFAAAAAANSCPGHWFNDVPPWVDKAVDYVGCLGLMEGFGNKFKPYDDINRAQVARLLYRIAGFPPVGDLPPHEFDDVPPWVEDAVKWLAANDYATGYETPSGTEFRPYIPITRAAVTRMLFRIAGMPTGSPPHSFTDVPEWVDDAVDWITDPANQPQFATGFAGNKFKPLDDINRAQTTRMVCRINSLADCG